MATPPVAIPGGIKQADGRSHSHKSFLVGSGFQFEAACRRISATCWSRCMNFSMAIRHGLSRGVSRLVASAVLASAAPFRSKVWTWAARGGEGGGAPGTCATTTTCARGTSSPEAPGCVWGCLQIGRGACGLSCPRTCMAWPSPHILVRLCAWWPQVAGRPLEHWVRRLLDMCKARLGCAGGALRPARHLRGRAVWVCAFLALCMRCGHPRMPMRMPMRWRSCYGVA